MESGGAGRLTGMVSRTHPLLLPAGSTRTQRAGASRFRLQERRAGEPGRAELEHFVAAAFARAHGARVHGFMPSLLALEDGSGAPRCTLGLRSAGSDPLFLEQYLDAPIETAIAAASRSTSPIPRGSIVEVGNLAGRGCRAAMYLVGQLPRFLLDRGFSWVSFTATGRVRELLERFDAPLLDLGPADPGRLAGGADDWGSYYRTRPRVMAGWLAHGLKGPT